MIRASIIKAGVNNLIEFGYPGCNEDNILTDDVYKEHFKCMLEENIEDENIMNELYKPIQDEMKLLLAEINNQTKE